MQNRTAYLVVFDGFSELDAAQAISRVRKTGDCGLKVLAPSLEPVTSQGGMRVLPDIDFMLSDLADIDDLNTALLILPGGDRWNDRGAYQS